MDGMTINLIYFVSTLLLIIPGGTSLKCYSCHSPLGQPCALNPSNANIEECKTDDPRCYLLTETKNNPKFVQRGCTSGPKCPNMPWSYGCSWCNSQNLCNDLVFNIPGENENNNNNGGSKLINLNAFFSFILISVTYFLS